MGNAVKSTDPRKAVLIKAFKEASGGTKITSVRDIGEGLYRARCHKHIGKQDKTPARYEYLGEYDVSLPVMLRRGDAGATSAAV